SIIKKHGGGITVESAPGAGTTVHLHLPATRQVSAPPECVPAAPRPPRRGKVLVMDDEAQICIVLGALLKRLHHEVELVPDGAMAVPACWGEQDEGRPCGAVLLDLTVKDGLGGWETLAALRKLVPGVTAIVMSGYADNRVLLEHALHGFKGALA